MKALVFDRAGDPLEVLQYRDVAEPRLEPGRVLVRIEARPIHPADRSFIRGQYRIRPEFPQVAGLEGAGVVVDTGTETGSKAGDRVAFRAPGAWGELIAVPVERLIRVPEGIDKSSACQVSLNPLTAFGLLQEAPVESGDWVIITAATSTVSNIVGVIARERGVRSIGLVRGDPITATDRCSADAVLAIDTPDIVAKILDASGGDRPVAILDSVGGPAIPRVFPALRPGATVVAYGVQSNEPAPVTNAMLIYSNLTWKGFGIDRWLSQNRQEVAGLVEAELWPMIHSGCLQLPVDGSYPLEDFERALRDDDRSGRRGKMLLL
jgi:NADPH:quinone reductase-like Zn-dependent oxidoreductase